MKKKSFHCHLKGNIKIYYTYFKIHERQYNCQYSRQSFQFDWNFYPSGHCLSQSPIWWTRPGTQSFLGGFHSGYPANAVYVAGGVMHSASVFCLLAEKHTPVTSTRQWPAFWNTAPQKVQHLEQNNHFLNSQSVFEIRAIMEFTVSPLHTKLQVVNFQKCRRAFYQDQVWVTLQLARRLLSLTRPSSASSPSFSQ